MGVGQPDQYPSAGNHDKAEVIQMLSRVGQIMPNGLDIKVTSTTAQDDRVVAEVESGGVNAAGKVYDQRLVFVFQLRHNKILRIREYLDTYLADTAVPLLSARHPGERVRREAFGAAAELAWLLGWKHHDLGQEGAAQAYYRAGFQLAAEADPHGHAAWMTRALAHQALAAGHRRQARDLAVAALDRAAGHVDRATEALLHVTHSRTLAALGERAAAARALLAAEDALVRGDGPQAGYSLLAGPAAGTFASHTARALTEAGDHAGAEARHRAAFTSWDPQAFPRVHVLTWMDLGDSLAAQARADEAVAAWGRALDMAGGMASARSRAALASARGPITAYRRRGVPGAAGLEQRMRQAGAW